MTRPSALRLCACLALLCAQAALASPPVPAEDRSPARALPLRILEDLVAIPASAASWEGADWALFTATFAGVAALMVDTPEGAPADLRLQRWQRTQLKLPRPLVWSPVGDAVVWASLWSPLAVTFALGWLLPSPRALELVSRVVEAFAVAQLYQLGFKLVLGREGPMQDGAALHGPQGFFRLFPAGTPSGHAATLYAMMGASSALLGDGRVTAAMQLFGALFCATLLVDDYHYASDILWGAVMGWAVGRWVATHRRSLPEQRLLEGAVIVPTVAPAGGRYGLTVALAF